LIYAYTVVKGAIMRRHLPWRALMNSTVDLADLSQGQALLSQLADGYFAILKTARLEEVAGSGVACTFEVSGVEKRTVCAPSSVEAIRLALFELASMLSLPSFSDSIRSMTANVSSTGRPGLTSGATVDRFRSKTRQLTVGVTMPTSLKEHLITLADSQGVSFAEVSRRFAVFGYEDFEDRSLFVSSKSLFDTFGRELMRWQNSDYEQVMLRLEPGQAVRIRSTAKEYGKSASEFGALCMAHGTVLQEQLVTLEEKVANCKGAAIRPFLTELGLGSYAAPLLSGVLAGHVRAPKALLKRLSTVFDAQETLLTTLFKRFFENRMVPAFKSEDGKPAVANVAIRWDVAVKSLNLPSDQTNALLDLGA
jgi:hypothetical protein